MLNPIPICGHSTSLPEGEVANTQRGRQLRTGSKLDVIVAGGGGGAVRRSPCLRVATARSERVGPDMRLRGKS